MRKSLLAGLALVALGGGAVAAFSTWHNGDTLAAGKQRLAHGDAKAAALYFRAAVRAKPNSAEAAYLLGTTDLALGNPSAAAMELRRARQLGWPDDAVFYPLGEAYLAEHRPQALLDDFDLDRMPPASHPEVLALRAAAEMMVHNQQEAGALAAQAEAGAPHDPKVLIIAAKIALVRGDEAGAAQRADAVLTAAPPPGQAIRDDALLLQGEIAMRHADAATALARARRVTAENPLRLDATLLEVRALAGEGRIAEARRVVGSVLKRAPRDVAANYLQAVLAIHDADYKAADSALQQIGPAISDLPRGAYFLAVTKLGVHQLALADGAARQFAASAPNDPSGQKLMAYVYLAENLPRQALQVLDGSVLAQHEDADTDDLRGRALGMLGDLAGARANFAKAAALHPADTTVLNRLAATELDLGHVAAGEADLKHSLALAPKQEAAGAALVQADLSRGDIDSARADLAHMRAALGDTDTAALLDAQIARASLDDAGAERILKAARKTFPGSIPLAIALFRTEKMAGQTEDARAVLQAALAIHPATPALLDLLLPELYAAGKTDGAVKAAEAAHDAAPADPRIVAALSDTYWHAGQHGRAIGLLDRASAGANPNLDLLRAHDLEADGKSGQAITVLQPILDHQPGDTAARLYLAALKVKTRDFDGARATLATGLAAVPGNPALMRAMIDVDFAEAGSAVAGESAAMATAKALQANPANLPASSMLPGIIDEAAGDAAAAAAAFKAAFAKAPSSALALATASAESAAGDAEHGEQRLETWTAAHPGDVAALLVLSSIQIDRGEDAKAEISLNNVLARDPANAAALNNLAWLKQHAGDLPAAKLLAMRAYFQSPGPDMADTLGWILQQQGDTPQALPFLKQAAQSGNAKLRAAAAYHYAVALAAAGDKAAARSEIKESLAQNVAFHDKPAAEKFAAGIQ